MGGIIPALTGTGQIVYMVIEDMATGPLWNGAALEVYNQSHWSNYAVSAPEQAGSGRYIMTIPGGLPAGSYWVTPYVQNAGSPVVGADAPLDILRLDWDGGSIIGLGSALNVGKINGSASAAASLAVAAAAEVTGAAAAGTLSTSQMTTNLGSTIANVYTGRVIIFTSGGNLGRAALITAYAVTGGKLTFIGYNNLPISVAPLAGDTFIII